MFSNTVYSFSFYLLKAKNKNNQLANSVSPDKEAPCELPHLNLCCLPPCLSNSQYHIAWRENILDLPYVYFIVFFWGGGCFKD